MPMQITAPDGITADVMQGVRAGEAVFAAANTTAEMAVFGHWTAQKFAAKRRCDPPSAEEQRLSDVYDLAKASALEACAGSNSTDGWSFGVYSEDGVWLWIPGATIEEHRRGLEAAREVFKENKITPQGAAIGDWEQQVHDRNGFEGPAPSEESSRAASIFWDAENAAFVASGDRPAPGRHLLVTGCDAPHWHAYMAQSPVLNFDPSKVA
jgi:hypothetical protein